MERGIRKRKQTFVLVVPRFEDIFHAFFAGEILKGVGLAASRLKIDVLLHITDRQDHRGWLDSTLLDPRYIDGIIFADIDNDLNVVKKAIRCGIPCLVLNNVLNEPINWIAVDNKKAAFDVVEYLKKSGHSKIATIAGDLSTQAGLMRLDGYKEAVPKCPPAYITHGGFMRTPARKAAEKLLSLTDHPTAVFVASDVMALELMAAARTQNIRIPEDLSVVGFDDNPIIHSSSIGLTTVRQPLVEMGRLGVENLFQVTQGKAKLPVKILLPTELVERQSVKRLKAPTFS